MKLTVHYFDEEIDSIPIAETDREVRTEGGAANGGPVGDQKRQAVPEAIR